MLGIKALILQKQILVSDYWPSGKELVDSAIQQKAGSEGNSNKINRKLVYRHD